MATVGLRQELSQKIIALSSDWTAYTVVASFVLYALGYLALRFHLTTLGIGTDLAVLDERYLFTGVRFLVYLVSTVPTIVLLTLVVLTLVYLPYCILPSRPRGIIQRYCARLTGWWMAPHRFVLTGIVFSVVMIQFVMRQCFFFTNLLVAPHLPPAPDWLKTLLLAENDGLTALYFSGIVAATAMAGSVLMFTAPDTSATARGRFLQALLAFLVSVQFLLIPINYGILVIDKSLPRVADLGGQRPLREGEQAWLAWEGKLGVTYLVREQHRAGDHRNLVTLLQADVKKIQISGYDRILRILFATPDGMRRTEKTDKDKELKR